ncbi:LysR family transcriptional regulator [Ramlibacter henchirensis]|uniref:LysR family transcriptional regulator n=1 Tax=Ramlibacter henchirensis TaxID=204072 RepID=A0A4Z0BWP7_9BURK|nr:LysR substrate-binding domain-containing protein [Ramlibacter henchirensis]TFZ02914.1 LysR family transcriptional regulator [Ramlibacter henchirensis]
MDLRQIRTFVHIAELRSFTRSATFLHVSQPALSRQIRLLEEELNLKLFHRFGHGVELTIDGIDFLERCQRMLADFESLRHDFLLKGKSSTASGAVSIGLPVPATRFISAEFLEDLRTAYPMVQVRIAEGFSALLHEWLLSGSLDLAILFEPRPSKILTHEPLLVEDLCAIRSVKSINAGQTFMEAQELQSTPLVLPHRPHVLRDLLDGLQFTKPHIIEVSATSVMVELARCGLGTAILPQASVDVAQRAGDVVALPIINPALSWKVSVCYSSTRSLTPAAEVVLELLRAEVTKKVRSGSWTARLVGRNS